MRRPTCTPGYPIPDVARVQRAIDEAVRLGLLTLDERGRPFLTAKGRDHLKRRQEGHAPKKAAAESD